MLKNNVDNLFDQPIFLDMSILGYPPKEGKEVWRVCTKVGTMLLLLRLSIFV